MDPSLLAPGLTSVAEQQDQAKRVKDAKETYQMIVKNAERTGRVIPAFDFLELIGKGAYGRVYKCRDQKTGSLVAVKITEVDSRDWIEATESGAPPRDDTIRDFRKEVSTLQQLKDKGIPNINVLHDAFDMHAQVWMISDYCTGGSVRTLMRPFAVNGEPRGLPEKYIIPIARELAIAIAGCHESGIIHRDIKCANVFITEDGKIQLGDFGVVGVLENQTDKRRTIIGTPHYMPQEVAEKLDQPLDEDEPGYGSEVDIWAYGCTLYEMATGHPPYWKVPPKKIHEAISKGPPRVTDESYSPELRDLIAMCTEIDPDQRPAATTILQHPAIANTSREYPTRSLVPLIERLKIWERGGGSRQSLWIQAPSDPRSPSADNGDDGSDNDHGKSSKWSMDGWNFSTSEDFDRRFSQLTSYNDANMQYLEAPHGAGLPPAVPQINTKDLTVAERIKREHTELSANRGEKLMARLFDPNDPTGYDSSSAAQNTPVEEPSPSSDLPLRNFTGDAPTRESMIEIDLDDAGAHGTATSVFALHMENEHTIKPIGRRFVDDEDDSDNFQFDQRDSGDKRDTMAWTFPSAPQPQTQLKRGTLDWTFSNAGPAQAHEAEPSMDEPDTGYGGELAPGVRPTIKHTATEPVGHFRGFSPDMAASLGSPVRESVASMIDLDLGFVDPYEHIQNPAEIARPSTASSAAGSTMTDMTSGNPFDLEEDPVQNELDRQRFSYHKQWQSEGGHMDRADHRAMPMHARGSSLSSTDSDMDPLNTINQRADPAAESMQHPPFNVDQGLGGLSPDEMNQWPNFSSFDGFDTSPQQFPSLSDIPRLGEPDFPLEHGLRTNTNGLASRSREPSGQPPGPTIDFPAVNPPHPEALVENANSQLLEQEFSRALNDMADSLDSMVQGFRQYMPVDDDDDGDVVSESEGTEDEGSAGEHLTYRRANR
ncbi:Serine threonine- kinase nak1 [Lecanosticta acicola]|uniref:non-specific serine/threonine protein kinase n=1 Tax=Lecanosticta acicola TaxID=111012 RepID=A0AAI8Z2N9_9PEZI|nr:Serine threonine- kinase nak1 [Lecanosticta acicola]